MNAGEWAALVGALVGASGLGGLGVKFLDRPKDAAAADASYAASRNSDVKALREIIAEVRESESRKDYRLTTLEARVAQLEERERHMLTRAAVHEAWDQLAFQALIAQQGDYPPPPPLIVGEVLPPGETGD